MSPLLASRRGPILLAALAVVTVAAVVALLVQTWRRTELAAKLAAAENRIEQIEERAARALAENEALRERLAELGETPPPAPTVSRPPQGASSLEQARLLVKLQQQLSAAENALSEAEGRARELEGQLQRAQEESKRLAGALEEYTEKLAGQARVLEAVQAELKTRNERLVQLEANNLLLHRQNRQVEEESARLRSLLRELEEINRRRENALAAIMRRYRELADQFRALAVPSPEPGEPRTADLSRVQNTLAMTEDELRQLSNLNAQAARLQRQLEKR